MFVQDRQGSLLLSDSDEFLGSLNGEYRLARIPIAHISDFEDDIMIRRRRSLSSLAHAVVTERDDLP